MLYDSFDKQIKGLKESYEDMENQVQLMRERLDSWNKDEELQKAKQEVREAHQHSLCYLTTKEMQNRDNFIADHFKKCIISNGRLIPRPRTWIYTLDYTALGTVISITCPICHETKDITDYDNM